MRTKFDADNNNSNNSNNIINNKTRTSKTAERVSCCKF